jgi:hypothetical protein
MNANRLAVIGVWAATLVAGVAVAVAAPGPLVYVYLALTLALAVVVAFITQLAVGEQVGFVARLIACTCGSLAIILLVALIRALATR